MPTIHAGLRLAAPFAAVALASAVAAPAQAVTTPPRDRSFGAISSLSNVQSGGSYQASSSLARSTAYVSAAASGSVRDEALHASVSTTQDGYNSCRVFDASCRWGDSAAVTIWDTVTVSPAAEGATRIEWTYTTDGIQTRGRWNGSSTAYAYFYFGTDPNAWYQPTKVTLGAANTFSGSFHVTQPNTKIYSYMALSVLAENGATADYSNTMRFDWVLPPGMTYTSASGQFMADRPQTPAAIPEPTTWALMICGFGGAGAMLRRRSSAVA